MAQKSITKNEIIKQMKNLEDKLCKLAQHSWFFIDSSSFKPQQQQFQIGVLNLWFKLKQ